MGRQRQKRVSGTLQSAISDIIRTKMKDPRVGFVTVTEVDISPDLRNARVYVSILGTEQDKKDSMDILKNAASFIQGELNTAVRLRYTPILNFYLDTSLDYSEKINDIFRKLHTPEDGTAD